MGAAGFAISVICGGFVEACGDFKNECGVENPLNIGLVEMWRLF